MHHHYRHQLKQRVYLSGTESPSTWVEGRHILTSHTSLPLNQQMLAIMEDSSIAATGAGEDLNYIVKNGTFIFNVFK